MRKMSTTRVRSFAKRSSERGDMNEHQHELLSFTGIFYTNSELFNSCVRYNYDTRE